MAINFGNIVSSANVLQAPCGGGRFRIDVVVNGVENGAGGTYSVFLYDDDTFPNPDDLLDQLQNVVVPAGVGAFRNIHRFMLNCDAQCNVGGRLGGSGERKAQVYAFVREVRAFGNRANSNITEVECVKEEECVIPSEGTPGGHGSHAPHATYGEHELGISLAASAGAVAQDTPVRIAYSIDEPEIQYFADDVDPDIRKIAIGDASLNLAQPVTARWRLSKVEAGILKDLRGSVVRFDAVTRRWSRIDSRFDGRSVSFDVGRGGLFGLAAHPRLGETSYASLKIPAQVD